MKKRKLILLILIIALLGVVGIGITLYFTVFQESTNNSSPSLPKDTDLNQQSFEYLAKVDYMKQITTTEANIIKTEIQTNLSKKMENLNLEENIDYTINNLDGITTGSNLNDFLNAIIVTSIESSTKATGNFIVSLSVQENISNRAIETVIIDKNEETALSEAAAESILNYILIQVQEAVSKGQMNKKDSDYKITNIELIKAGAKFAEYKNQIKVQGISNRLTGEFLIKFQIEQ